MPMPTKGALTVDKPRCLAKIGNDLVDTRVPGSPLLQVGVLTAQVLVVHSGLPVCRRVPRVKMWNRKCYTAKVATEAEPYQ
jgi:hypothetical protein